MVCLAAAIRCRACASARPRCVRTGSRCTWRAKAVVRVCKVIYRDVRRAVPRARRHDRSAQDQASDSSDGPIPQPVTHRREAELVVVRSTRLSIRMGAAHEAWTTPLNLRAVSVREPCPDVHVGSTPYYTGAYVCSACMCARVREHNHTRLHSTADPAKSTFLHPSGAASPGCWGCNRGRIIGRAEGCCHHEGNTHQGASIQVKLGGL